MAHVIQAQNPGFPSQIYTVQPQVQYFGQAAPVPTQSYVPAQARPPSPQPQRVTGPSIFGGRTVVHEWATAFGDNKSDPNDLPEVVELSWESVKDLKDGRVATYTSTAVVTTFFAAIEATLLTGNTPPAPSTPELRGAFSVRRFYLFTTYAAMISAIGITISSLFLVDLLSTMNWKWRGESIQRRRMPRSAGSMIMAFMPRNMRGQYLALEVYFYILTYLGTALVITQLLTYIWLYESDLLAGTLTPMIALLLLPCLFRFFL